LRGIDAELEGGLEGSLAEVREEVADRPLGLVDNVARLSAVDGGGDVDAELLEAVAEECAEVGGGKFGLGVHGEPRQKGWETLRRTCDSQTPAAYTIRLPEDLPHPDRSAAAYSLDSREGSCGNVRREYPAGAVDTC
jgi:hypothetical protein